MEHVLTMDILRHAKMDLDKRQEGISYKSQYIFSVKDDILIKLIH